MHNTVNKFNGLHSLALLIKSIHYQNLIELGGICIHDKYEEENWHDIMAKVGCRWKEIRIWIILMMVGKAMHSQRMKAPNQHLLIHWIIQLFLSHTQTYHMHQNTEQNTNTLILHLPHNNHNNNNLWYLPDLLKETTATTNQVDKKTQIMLSKPCDNAADKCVKERVTERVTEREEHTVQNIFYSIYYLSLLLLLLFNDYVLSWIGIDWGLGRNIACMTTSRWTKTSW